MCAHKETSPSCSEEQLTGSYTNWRMILNGLNFSSNLLLENSINL